MAETRRSFLKALSGIGAALGLVKAVEPEPEPELPVHTSGYMQLVEDPNRLVYRVGVDVGVEPGEDVVGYYSGIPIIGDKERVENWKEAVEHEMEKAGRELAREYSSWLVSERLPMPGRCAFVVHDGRKG